MRIQRNMRFLAFSLLHFCYVASAQTHLSEKRISVNETPQKIVIYIQENHPNSKGKYYKIVLDDNTIQYEVILKKEEGLTFIIFDDKASVVSSGNTIDYKIIPSSIKGKINKDLAQRFSKFRVGKCKQQTYKGAIYYEIALTADKKKHVYQYDSEGQFIQSKLSPDKPLGPIFH